MSSLGKHTLCIHNQPDTQTGAIVPPIHMSTSYRFPNDKQEVIYPGSHNTPALEEVERKMAALEQAESAMMTASGQSAITATLLSFLSPGDHVIFHGEQYGGTTYFILNVLEKYGIKHDFVFGNDVADFHQSIRPETKVIYFESPTNPLLTALDMQAISELAKARKLITIIDSTFATPINQNPISCGIDVVLHSGTKYLNGHSDVSCGVIVTSKARMEKIRPMVVAHGAVLHPQAVYLLDRGLKTLALRVEKQNDNAKRIAQFLLEKDGVKHVYYPGLAQHRSHAVAQKQMQGFGGIITFELVKSPEEIERCLFTLKVIQPAVSLGGVESLISQPYKTSQRMMTPEMRDKLNISDRLVRLSVGIENVEDLIRDLQQALLD